MKINKTCMKILRYRKDHPFVFYSMILYLGAILGYVIVFHLFFADHSKPMPLNEIGDFLAGVFAPVAFFYLYLGYIQQGTELKQNTYALNLQAKELQNSVEQQRELVLATKEEIDLNKNEIEHQRRIQHIQAQPFFHFKDSFIDFNEKNKCHFLMFTLYNSRATCRDLQIIVLDKSYNDPSKTVLLYPRHDLLLGHSEKEYVFQPRSLGESVKPNQNGAIILELGFKFFDAFDNEQFQIFQFIALPNAKDGKVFIHRMKHED
ncbi:hypothetical protein [Acinetobacter baumannii]|uniref:hypothetical protein n=1 Tax=Acinetobacter baumannii TaxID=470 RepID=UPI003892C28F